MAANDLSVIDSTGTPRSLRSVELGSGSNIHEQAVLVSEMFEVPASVTGATVRHTISSNTTVTLDPPTAGAHYARVRVYETTGPFAGTPNPYKRLYYRQDGTAPATDGSNAVGFLMHGEAIFVKLANFTNFQMTRDSTDAGTFQVYVEWLNIPST